MTLAMTDTEQYCADIEAHEGNIPWMYLDTRGNVTCGIGQLLATAKAACELPWMFHAADATAAEITAEWERVKAMEVGHTATFYPDGVDEHLTLPKGKAIGLLENHVNRIAAKVAGLLCDATSEAPLAARRVLVDMAYNLGWVGLLRFQNLLRAVARQEWGQAAIECHTSSCRDSRNDWRRKLFESLVPDDENA